MRLIAHLIAVMLLFFSHFGKAQSGMVEQHNNLRRTGLNDYETELNQSSVSQNAFGKIFARTVDDQVYGQPLVINSILVNGKKRNLLIVCTVNNTVYAFDADNPVDSLPLWMANLTCKTDSAKYRPVKNTDMTGACNGNYQNFSGNIGIVSTPAIDTAAKTIFVLARSVREDGKVFVQYLHSLNFLTGNEQINSPVKIEAKVSGIGAGNVDGIISFDSQIQNQRAALLLYEGTVFIEWASHCDWGNFHGWMLGYDSKTLTQKYCYNASANGYENGIWMSGQGPAVDENGYIYISTGNGAVGFRGDINDFSNRGESLIKMSTKSGKLWPVDAFTPSDFSYMNTYDLDYGVDGVMLLPNSHLSLSGSKESYLYLVDNDKMGGVSTNDSNILQKLDVNASNSSPEKHLHGSPVYFKASTGAEFVYAWAEGGVLKQFPFDRERMLFDTLNTRRGLSAIPIGMPGAMLSVSSNQENENTGIVWASHPIRGNANDATVPGILQAFSADDVSQELWNSNMNAKRDKVDGFAKFSPPTVVNGKVYLATFSNQIIVYGLNASNSGDCRDSLPEGFKEADIGYMVLPGSVCDSSGTFSFQSCGDSANLDQDVFHFLYRQESNDVEVFCRPTSNSSAIKYSATGLEARSSLDPGSPSVFLGITTTGQIQFQFRTDQNYDAHTMLHDTASFPTWLKLRKIGNKFVGYFSKDSIVWKVVDSIVLTLGTNPYIGVSYNSGAINRSQIGTVDNFSFKRIDSSFDIGSLALSGRNQDNIYAQLSWTDSTARQGGTYIIQKAGGNRNFENIGSVGIDTTTKKFLFSDTNPENGIQYYRIAYQSNLVSLLYSNLIALNFSLDQLLLYPNPLHGTTLHVKISPGFIDGGELSIKIFNTNGKTVFEKHYKDPSDSFSINFPQLKRSGMYFFKAENHFGKKLAMKLLIR